MVPIAGGARILGATDSTALRWSYPQEFVGTHPIGWTGQAEEIIATGDPWSLQVDVICAPIADPTVPKSALVGRWKGNFSEADAKGLNDGVLQNGTGFAAGVLDAAFSFDATSLQWVEVPGSDFYPEFSFSVDAWIVTDTLSPQGTTDIVNLYELGGIEPSNNSTWALRLTSDGHAHGTFRDATTGSATAATGVEDLTDAEPHHLVLVRDLADDEIRLYVDGQAISEDTMTSNFGPLLPLSGADPLSIGIWRKAGTAILENAFTGLIDDVKFYDRALLGEEIQNIAGCGVPVLPRTINLDASQFGAPPFSDPIYKLCVYLEAGAYELELTNPAFDPDARFTGWSPSPTSQWGTVYSVEGEVDPGTASGVPVGYASAQEAFDATLSKTATLTLTVDQRVYFTVFDNEVLTNRGGVSIKLPEPPLPGGLLGGSLMLAWLSRRARKRGGRSPSR